jgi:hypothetical protein
MKAATVGFASTATSSAFSTASLLTVNLLKAIVTVFLGFLRCIECPRLAFTALTSLISKGWLLDLFTVLRDLVTFLAGCGLGIMDLDLFESLLVFIKCLLSLSIFLILL